MNRSLILVILLSIVLIPVVVNADTRTTNFPYSISADPTNLPEPHPLFNWSVTQRLYPISFTQEKVETVCDAGSCPSAVTKEALFGFNLSGDLIETFQLHYTMTRTGNSSRSPDNPLIMDTTLTGDFENVNWTDFQRIITQIDFVDHSIEYYDDIGNGSFGESYDIDYSEPSDAQIVNETDIHGFFIKQWGAVMGEVLPYGDPQTTIISVNTGTSPQGPGTQNGTWGSVNVNGYVNDYTGAVVSGAKVNATQGVNYLNTTSTAVGIYNFTGLANGTAISLRAAKAGYTDTTFGFTPWTNGTHFMNLTLFASYIPNSTAIIGVAYTEWSSDPISGATVSLSNNSWSAGTTTNSAGYYIFDNLLPGGVYNVSASAADHHNSATYEVTTVTGETVIRNLPLEADYILTVYARDGITSNLLVGTPVYIQLSDTQTANTSAGFTTFGVDGGYYTVTGTATGYSAAQTSVSVTGDSSATLLLYNSTASTGAGINYPPHQVRFAVKNQWGAPLDMIAVTAQGYETTAGDWDWLASLFGISLSSTPIHNASMAGNTGKDGSIVFMMIESVKYDMTLVNATQGVNETYTVYPKDDYYEIWVTVGATWFNTGYNALDEINISVRAVRINTTYGFINITYKDALAGTTNCTMQVNQTNKTAVDLPDTTVTSAFKAANSDFNQSFTVPANDDSYFVVFAIQHNIFGNVTRVFSVIFEKAQVGIGLPSSWLIYLAVFFVMFTAMFFGAVTSPTIGAVITCFVGWIMWSIGWLADMGAAAPVALVFATFLSVLSAIMVRSRKERYL